MISELSWDACIQLLHAHKDVWANLSKQIEILVWKTSRDERENTLILFYRPVLLGGTEDIASWQLAAPKKTTNSQTQLVFYRTQLLPGMFKIAH